MLIHRAISVHNQLVQATSVHLRAGISFTDMFGKLNRFLMEDIAGSGMFVTVAAARIDARRRQMHFAGAGHPPAMIARGSHSPVLLQSGSMVLGALPDAEATSDSLEVELEPDDRVVLYTDGITDVFNFREKCSALRAYKRSCAKPRRYCRKDEATHS